MATPGVDALRIALERGHGVVARGTGAAEVAGVHGLRVTSSRLKSDNGVSLPPTFNPRPHSPRLCAWAGCVSATNWYNLTLS